MRAPQPATEDGAEQVAEAASATPSADPSSLSAEEIARLSGAREDCPIYGGQALIEGVMMRGPHYIAAAVRREDGEIVVRTEPLRSLSRARPLFRLPVIRGIFALWDALSVGLRYLTWSGDVLMEEAKEQEQTVFAHGEVSFVDEGAVGVCAIHRPSGMAITSDRMRTREANRKRAERILRGRVARAAARAAQPTAGMAGPVTAAQQKEARGAISGVASWITLVLAFAVALVVFLWLPYHAAHWLTQSVLQSWESESGGAIPLRANVTLNLIEGGLRLTIFFLYVLAISLLPDIRRVFQHHGAEHKVIHAVENEAPLTVDGARPFSTLHPRCGSNFIAIAICVAVLLLSFIRADDRLVQVGLRLALLPAIAAIAYEVLKLAGRFRRSWPMRIATAPGMLLQRITTREPDDSQTEVAVRAMREVIALESRGGL